MSEEPKSKAGCSIGFWALLGAVAGAIGAPVLLGAYVMLTANENEEIGPMTMPLLLVLAMVVGAPVGAVLGAIGGAAFNKAVRRRDKTNC